MALTGDLEYSVPYDKNSYSGAANLFRLFSNIVPIRILYCLRQKGRTLSEISKSLKLSPGDILPWLSALQENGILVSRRGSRKIYHHLSDPEIVRSLDLVGRISREKLKPAKLKRPGSPETEIKTAPIKRRPARLVS